MIVRSKSRKARTVLSASALILAAAIFAFPTSATAKLTNRQRCFGYCSLGDKLCFDYCNQTFPKKKASIAPALRPIAGTGASTRPTHLHR